MDKVDQLAKRLADLHKANRNPPSSALRVGTVIQTRPLEIQWGESVLLRGEKLLVPRGFACEAGDKVTIAPDESGKMFFVLNILE